MSILSYMDLILFELVLVSMNDCCRFWFCINMATLVALHLDFLLEKTVNYKLLRIFLSFVLI